ncbi:MAG: hypothetical protein JRG81_15845 [Deltaproteobacteria bacterium]|nr:hypothetical protein [Deltaproteobacteria bacterium]MBW2181819.1 hypothetical protein [Deltaproteobacteria bacterium]
MIENFKIFILLALCLIVLGCFDNGKNAASGIKRDNKMDILRQFSRDDPDHLKSMIVYGTNPSGTMLCFRKMSGETFIYRLKLRKSERIEHARLIGPEEVTNITYSGVAFVLWAGERKLLSIGAKE